MAGLELGGQGCNLGEAMFNQHHIKGLSHRQRLRQIAVWAAATPLAALFTTFTLRLRVASGPFAGMRTVMRRHTRALSAKLLGTYERELVPVFAAVLTLPLQSIIDVSAADGYTLVGLARLSGPGVRKLAFEMSEEGRGLIARLAARNRVKNLAIEGHCTLPRLSAALRDGGTTLVLCDAQGAEKDLMDPAAIPGLGHCHVLIEVDELHHPGVGALIEQRFAASHSISRYQGEPRRPQDFPHQSPLAQFIRPEVAVQAMDEGRVTPANWMFLQPRAQ